MPDEKLKVLLLLEGSTDIRFVAGLSRICDLTVAAPMENSRRTGLLQRMKEDKVAARFAGILDSNRWGYQVDCLKYLWRNAPDFDVILAQEVLRGALNACLVGAIRRVPVVTYAGISPLEYFRCRWERREIGWLRATAGLMLIRLLMILNGRLATRCLAMGPYLQRVAARYCPRTQLGLYYGVDTQRFVPAEAAERARLRRARDLPSDFLILFSSRISHEKDPETVLLAVAELRRRGIAAVVLNLSGQADQFLRVAQSLALPDPSGWVLARPAVHPHRELPDFFRCADVLVQASLAEGAAYSTLEALACGVPVVATRLGGMELQLEGKAQLTRRRDWREMADALQWVYAHRDRARAQAERGRAYVEENWRSEIAFSDLHRVLNEVAGGVG